MASAIPSPAAGSKPQFGSSKVANMRLPSLRTHSICVPGGSSFHLDRGQLVQAFIITFFSVTCHRSAADDEGGALVAVAGSGHGVNL